MNWFRATKRRLLDRIGALEAKVEAVSQLKGSDKHLLLLENELAQLRGEFDKHEESQRSELGKLWHKMRSTPEPRNVDIDEFIALQRAHEGE